MQLQDGTRDIYVLAFGASCIRDFTVVPTLRKSGAHQNGILSSNYGREEMEETTIKEYMQIITIIH